MSEPSDPFRNPDSDPPGAPTPQPAAEPSRQRTGVLEREREVVEQPVEPGDHERFAHYVRKEKILASAMSGDPVVALCGKVWVPGRDPGRFPVCPACKDIYDGLKAPKDGGGPGGGGGQGG